MLICEACSICCCLAERESFLYCFAVCLVCPAAGLKQISKMALLGEYSKCGAVIKALISLGIFIGICAGIVYLLVHSSNAKTARGGDGFGMPWSGTDRSKRSL